jgi:hypothetical protein
MDCREFIARFSEYYDGTGGADETGRMEAHLEVCASCRRYHRIVTKGGQLLRSLPSPELPPDFEPRLQHRIYHVADEAALARTVSSGTTGATAFAMALLLTAVAWSPSMKDTGPAADLTPILTPIEVPSVDPFGPSAAGGGGATLTPEFNAPRSLFGPPNRLTGDQQQPESGQRLWVHTHSLLYEYSPLSEKYRQDTRLRRTDFDR